MSAATLGFSRAARTASRLGVPLMIRTTRRRKRGGGGGIRLSSQDGTCDCRPAIGRRRSFEFATRSHRDTPITVPANSVSHVIMKAVVEHRKRLPAVNLEPDFSDRRVELIGEGYDIAFRPGRLPDSSLLAKRVGCSSRILVAAPSYLRGVSAPKQPRDLRNHACLTLVTAAVETTRSLRSSHKAGTQRSMCPRDSLPTPFLP